MLKRRYLSEALYPMQSPVAIRPRPRLERQPFRYAVPVPAKPTTTPVKLTLFDPTTLVSPPNLESPRTPARL
ncbi:MAG: hypothetical protein AB1597_00950 [Chloroflexota bacterium]